MRALATAALLLFLFLAGCDQLALPGTDTPPPPGAGVARLVVIDKSSYPSGAGAACAEPVTGYTDTNAGMPANPRWGVPHGPVETGTFSGQFTWGSLTSPISYTLDEPPPGVERTYTFTLVRYNSSLNRCLTTPRPSVSHTDRPLSPAPPAAGVVFVTIRPLGPGVPPGENAASCRQPITTYTDNNPGLPVDAPFGVALGPAEPGFFEGTFRWNGSPIPFSYTIAAPPAGTRRDYTFTLVRYDTTLNRCISGRSVAPTYVDRPL